MSKQCGCGQTHEDEMFNPDLIAVLGQAERDLMVIVDRITGSEGFGGDAKTRAENRVSMLDTLAARVMYHSAAVLRGSLEESMPLEQPVEHFASAYTGVERDVHERLKSLAIIGFNQPPEYSDVLYNQNMAVN